MCLQEDVAPFVEVCFQAHCERTHSAFGASPQWHETIQFPFQPPGNDFSANNLQVIADHVHINLFDELTVDIPKDNRNKDEIHQRRERRWLGSLSIPFNAIYRNKEVVYTMILTLEDHWNIQNTETCCEFESPHGYQQKCQRSWSG